LIYVNKELTQALQKNSIFAILFEKKIQVGLNYSYSNTKQINWQTKFVMTFSKSTQQNKKNIYA